jgi:glycosyltransferase involved in cell wall biosynthesis
LKITHVATGYPLSFEGGVTKYLRTLIAEQLKQGLTVNVIGGTDEKTVEGVEYDAFGGARPPFTLKIEKDPDAARRFLEVIARRDADVVHFHMGIDLPLEFWSAFPNEHTQPYVVSLHDYYYICPRVTLIDFRGQVSLGPSREACRVCVGKLDKIHLLHRASERTGLPLPRWPDDAVVERLATMKDFLRGASMVLPVSNRVEALYREVVPDATYRTLIIGNPSANAARNEATRHPSAAIRATFLGTLSDHKGAGVLLQLLRSTRRADLEVHFYGRAYGKWGKQLRRAGLIDHGPYTAADLGQIMSRTDLGVALPIWEDNGPQVVMEFVNHGVPMLATRMGGIPDFVPDGAGYLFDPRRSEEIAAASAWLGAVSHDELTAMAARLRPLPTPADHARAVADVYRSITGG